jgi:hypothetical protein
MDFSTSNMPRRIESENDVKKLVKDWYDAHESWHYAPIQNGMGEHGIHDRVGAVTVTVTPEMVGKRIAILTTVEAKKPGRRGEARRGMSVHQERHLNAIRAAGGLSTVCDGEEDLAVLNTVIERLTNGPR